MTNLESYIIQLRDGVQFNDEGYTIDGGRVVAELATLEADSPAAALRLAEPMLRAQGITWRYYTDGPWSVGWHTNRGIVTLRKV